MIEVQRCETAESDRTAAEAATADNDVCFFPKSGKTSVFSTKIENGLLLRQDWIPRSFSSQARVTLSKTKPRSFASSPMKEQIQQLCSVYRMTRDPILIPMMATKLAQFLVMSLLQPRQNPSLIPVSRIFSNLYNSDQVGPVRDQFQDISRTQS